MAGRFETPYRKLLIGVLLAMALLVLMEAVGQIVYYIRYDTFYWIPRVKLNKSTYFSAYTLIDYPANANIYMPGYPEVLETDRYGFISNGHDREISASDYNIFVLGGSTVEGRGASSNTQTICAQLERILRQRGNDTKRKITVVNAGRMGFVSYQEFNLLASRLVQEFSPDLVISLSGRNDAYYLVERMGNGWKPHWQPYYDELEQRVNTVSQSPVKGAFYLLAQGLGNYSTIVRRMKKLAGEENPEKYAGDLKVPSNIVTQGARSFISAQILSKTVADIYGFTYLTVLQPVLVPKLKTTVTEDEGARLKTFIDKYPRGKHYFSFMEEFFKTVKANATQLTWFYDLSGVFQDVPETMYFDTCHYNDTGNRIIAERLAEIITPFLEGAGHSE